MADCCGDASSEINVKSTNFICGVVEGFYGRPWTTDQRKDLFQKMKKWGMDSYVYAPKDDYKHRAYWRELYTVEEAEHLTSLISAARAQGVAFYYALSPGLDITYSSQKEVAALKRKLEQVSQFGCTAFALLFDDIEPEMSEADKEIFQSFAHAQVSVTNEIQQHLGGAVVRFLLCPTQYCGTRALPTVTSSEYLTTLGAKLSKDIDIMWTGQKVISKVLTAACIEEISRVLRRPPVIWDNLHANDYDQKRMFLGPYSGRSPELIPLLRGVLSNPNCEYNANMVPIRTLAHWANCSVDASTNIDSVAADIKLEKEGGINEDDGPVSVDKHVYHHRQALRNAVSEWLPEFAIEKNATGPIVKPQPTVCVAAVPIIPILPSVNTCMSLITPTTTTMATSKGPTSTTSAGIPTVNTSQLQALADVCTTVSSTEMFNPTANPIMNSLVSATKVVTNNLLHNPIPPIATSNVALPSEIPVSTVPVAIMGLKSFGDGEILGTDPLKDVKKIDGVLDVESDETMHDLPIPGSKEASGDALETKNVEVGNENVLIGEQNGTHTIPNNDEDSSADIVVDDFDSKEVPNGAMSIGESPCTLSPLHPTDHAMECTPEHETATSIMETKHQLTVQSSDLTNAESPTHDIDVVMADGCNENGDFLQVNSPGGDMIVESNDSNDSYSSSPDVLTVEDLMLLCDLFYLPFEHGSQALKLLQEFNWLKCNAPVLLSLEKNNSTLSAGAKKRGANKSECQEWHSRARRFGSLCGRVSRLSRRLAKCNNRELLHDICGYVWDLRAVVGLLQSYVKWLAIGKFPSNICEFTQGSYTWFSKGWKEAFMSGDQEPWVFRGGLTADLQRLMPIDNGNDLLAYRPPTSPTSELYTIRPFMDSDKTRVCDICRKTSKDGMDSSDLYPSHLQELPSDRILGPFLALVPELLLVAEEEIENRKDMNSPPLLGFASAVTDTRAFQIRQEREWAPLMRTKYPLANLAVDDMTDAAKDAIQNFHQFKLSTPDSVLRTHPASMICSVLPHCSDHSAPKRLITCLLAALRANGVFAVHTCINKTDHYLNQFYTKLGFIEIYQDTLLEKIYLGRTF